MQSLKKELFHSPLSVKPALPEAPKVPKLREAEAKVQSAPWTKKYGNYVESNGISMGFLWDFYGILNDIPSGNLTH